MKQSPLVFGVTVLTLGILSVTPVICANEASEVDTNSKATPDPFAPDSRVSLSLPLQTSENFSFGAVTESPAGEPDSSELNRELTNPVSSLWSISNQFNNFELNNGHWNNNWNFQPVMPVSLTKDWNLITRPVMPFYNIVPHETAPGEFDAGRRAGRSGSGGVAVACALGQLDSRSGTYRHLSDCDLRVHRPGQMAARPSVVVGYLTKEFFLGVFPQQWWSIGGEHGRRDTNQMNLQPIAALFFGEGWSIGYSGNILADWTAPSEDVWTVPVGLALGKVVKFGRLPVKIQLAVQYMPVHPRISGQEWNVQVSDHSCPSEAHQGRPVPVTRENQRCGP